MLPVGLQGEILSHIVIPTICRSVAPAEKARAYRVRILESLFSIPNVLAEGVSELEAAANGFVQAEYGYTL
jgi:hypothetical protein